MNYPIFQVDAFTGQMFRGNPAAVCILEEPREDSWMLSLAQEMNLSETAFITPCEKGYNLRWFTPVVEVDLCGHATLASAHILWEEGILKAEQVANFFTKSGPITARRTGDWIEMDFPEQAATKTVAPDGLASALGVTVDEVHYNGVDYLVPLDAAKTIRALEPDFQELKKINTRGVIVTSLADTAEYDFISRFFAPRVGISEDPVTGSAHCCLGPYWSERLGKKNLVGFQASSRGGVVRVTIENNKVVLGGQAVTCLRGQLQ